MQSVEIRDDQYAALEALAAKRGERGFSRLLQELLDTFLHTAEDAAHRRRAADAIAAFESFTEQDGESLARHVEEVRGRWC
jgi:predicted CopG family antitoxin